MARSQKILLILLAGWVFSLYFLFSYFLVVFGQFSGLKWLGPVAAVFGFALFWRALLPWKGSWKCAGLAFSWFLLVQAVQLSWLATSCLVGEGIFFVYALFVVLIAAQFAFFSWRVVAKDVTLRRAAALAGLWVFFEWGRLFISQGFTWNPVGLSLAALPLTMQIASLFGIYGLSFWVIFVNLAALRAWVLRTRRAVMAWGFFALLPFAYGGVQIALFSQKSPAMLNALLVQTNLLPDQKEQIFINSSRFIPALDQWSRILTFVEKFAVEKPDLIVLSEAALPFNAHRPIYPTPEIKRLWVERFGQNSLVDFSDARPFMSNAFVLQSLANHYGSEVIAGLADRDLTTFESFNAAFHFLPEGKRASRYEKRILLPIGEYIPFKGWKIVSEWLADAFNVEDSFVPGKEAKLFLGKIPIGVSICYEETFAHLIREARTLGAELFVNVTNDGWYPNSRLPKEHFAHGVVRAVENGVPLLRACTTGVTAGVDCFGRVVAAYPEAEAGALFVKIPLTTFPTLYTLWGNWGILFLSGAFMLFFLRRQIERSDEPRP